jgi:hypothetical protein
MKALEIKVYTPWKEETFGIPVLVTKRLAPPALVCVFEGYTQAPMILEWVHGHYLAHGWIQWVPLIEPNHVETLKKGKGIILGSPKVVFQPFASEEALKEHL